MHEAWETLADELKVCLPGSQKLVDFFSNCGKLTEWLSQCRLMKPRTAHGRIFETRIRLLVHQVCCCTDSSNAFAVNCRHHKSALPNNGVLVEVTTSKWIRRIWKIECVNYRIWNCVECNWILTYQLVAFSGTAWIPETARIGRTEVRKC